MYLNDDHLVSVTREFQWFIEKIEEYLVSEVFEIFWEDTLTKWQLNLYRKDNKVYACLKKIKSERDFCWYELPENDFIVNLSINEPEKKLNVFQKQIFDGEHFIEKWFYAHNLAKAAVTGSSDATFVESFFLNIKINLKQKSKKCCHEWKKNYYPFFNSEKISDIKIICSDGKELPAHRFILVAYAPTLYKMLAETDQKSGQKRKREIDVHSDVMMEVLRFLYTGEIKGEGMESILLEFGREYQVSYLESCVIDFMAKNLAVDNVIHYYHLAKDYNNKHFLEKCFSFILENYIAVQETEEWYEFSLKKKTIFKMSYLRNEQKNPVYVLKTLMAYKSTELPSDVKPFDSTIFSW